MGNALLSSHGYSYDSWYDHAHVNSTLSHSGLPFPTMQAVGVLPKRQLSPISSQWRRVSRNKKSAQYHSLFRFQSLVMQKHGSQGAAPATGEIPTTTWAPQLSVDITVHWETSGLSFSSWPIFFYSFHEHWFSEYQFLFFVSKSAPTVANWQCLTTKEICSIRI